MELIELEVAVGFAQRGSLFGDPAKVCSAMLIVPAMGVLQRFCADVAEWLAPQGRFGFFRRRFAPTLCGRRYRNG